MVRGDYRRFALSADLPCGADPRNLYLSLSLPLFYNLTSTSTTSPAIPRLLWGMKGLRVTLGSALLQLQMEAFFDQPRMRPLVKRLRLWLDNTASSDTGRGQRAQDILTTIADLAQRLSHLETLRFDGPENAQPSLEDILDRAFVFPHLTGLELGRWATNANAGRRLPCSLSTVYRAFDVWPSLKSLALDIPLLLDSRMPPTATLTLHQLSFGADFDLPFDVVGSLLSATKPHLTSFALTGRDDLLLDVLARLGEPGWHLKRLELGGKSGSDLFNLGSQAQSPSNALFEMVASLLPHLASLERLCIDSNNRPYADRALPITQRTVWGHQLDVEEFWAALPLTLRTLRIHCVVGRRAKGVMEYLEKRPPQRARLEVLAFCASEGRAVGMRCEELGIRFGELAPCSEFSVTADILSLPQSSMRSKQISSLFAVKCAPRGQFRTGSVNGKDGGQPAAAMTMLFWPSRDDRTLDQAS